MSRGRLQVIYSHNVKTFVSALKWVQKINKDVEFRDFLASEKIKWKFNLSRAQWWGGEIERMIRLMKQMVYKAMGNAHLTTVEMQEAMLDIKINMNNQPLAYLDVNIETAYSRTKCFASRADNQYSRYPVRRR